MKRKSLLLAALMLAVTLCFGLAACGEEKVALKDFPAEKTETAELGSVYELKTQAEGEDGKVYRLSSEVVTGDGGAVAVFENKFDVTDISGYTITYTAVVTSGEAPESVVTLNVTDNTAPEISINKPDAGILNEEYCLPRFTVTDLADSDPAVTVKVSYVSGTQKEEVSLTEREGRYYFTPEKLGSYEIAVTATKSNGKSKTATRTFVVDQPVLEGEVFSPDVMDPASQISFVAAGGVPTEKLIVGTGTSEEGAYAGKYLTIDGSEIGENLWVDIHLTPRQSIESYAEFDVVEFWVYFAMTGENAKIGILGGSTAATDPLLREFAGNTWAKISVDADIFFDKIDSARLFTVNFNNAGSGNHAGLTEVRIGTVMAKYAFGPEVTVDAPEVTAGSMSAVTLTADTDVAFTAQIKNDKDEVQECVVENGAVTASLPMGSYTYTLTSQDDMYIGSVTGSFTVESRTKIVLPEAAAGAAGTAYTIPDASVTVDGAVQEGVKATYTATFVQGLNGKKSEQVESGFVPLTAGTLTVVYSYAGAASQTLTVEIAAAQPAGNVVFDPSTATSGNIVSNNGIQVYEAVKGEEGAAYEGDYIRITATASSWTNTRLTLGLTDDSYAEYDKIGVWVYYAATGTVTSSLFNDNDYKVQYAPNEWHLVLVDRDAFVEKMTGSQKDLLALAFTVNGVTGSGNFPGLTEVRLGAIVALKSFDEAQVSPIDSVNEGENASVTITVNEDVQSLTAVIKNADGIEQDVTVEGKTVKATLPVGNYTYVITTDDPLYTGTIEGSFSVESKTKIVLPEAAAGTAGTAYTIPDASVTVDGAVQEGEKATYTATFVQGLNAKKSEQVESGFVPLTAGTLTVVYSYAGAASQTLTVEIAAAQPAGNVVFDPSTATNENFTSTNGSLHAAVAGDPEADYTGSYISITQSGTNVWSDLHLHLGDVSYAEYDVIEFWVYFVMTGETAKIGILGGSTGATDPLLREFAGNTWAKISVDADTFFELIGSKTLFPINFNNATSGNHAGVTEVRLGAIVALKSFDEAEVSPIDSVNEGENASVTITVNEDAQSLTAVIKNAEGEAQTSSVQGNTVTASLPAGKYTYEITTSDPLYTGTITGEFSVESKTQIVLPDVTDFHIPAMEEYVIPEAGITVDGAVQEGVKANMTAVFTPAYGGGAEENITDPTFTPASSGELVITYTYEGAVAQQLTIFVDRAENTTGALLDLRNADVLEYATPAADTFVGYDKEGQYLTWTGSGNWKLLKINFNTTVAALQEQGYAYLKVQVYYQTDGATGNVTGWFCGKAMFGTNDTADGKLRMIPHDTWYTAYIPLSDLTDNILKGSADILQIGFDQGDGTSGHFPKVQEVRLKGFVPVTQPDERTEFLDMSDDSVAGLFTKPSGTFEYVPENNGEQAYLSWKGTGTWQHLYLDPNTRVTCNAETAYEYIAVELYYVSSEASNGISGWFLHGDVKYRNDRDHAGLQANTWITVYLSVDMFYSSSTAAGTRDLLQCSFGQTGSHFPGISEIRIGGMFFTNTPGNGETDYTILTDEV